MINLFRKPKSTGAKLPAFLPILVEMAHAWESVTPEDLDRCNRNISPLGKDDTKLGVIYSLETRRTFALMCDMRTRCAEAKLHAQSKAQSEDEVRFDREQAERFDAMCDCLKELFFAQARDDIGGKAWEGNVGIRSGWWLGAMQRSAHFNSGGSVRRDDGRTGRRKRIIRVRA